MYHVLKKSSFHKGKIGSFGEEAKKRRPKPNITRKKIARAKEKIDFKTIFTPEMNMIFFKIIELPLPSYVFKKFKDIFNLKKQKCIHQ